MGQQFLTFCMGVADYAIDLYSSSSLNVHIDYVVHGGLFAQMVVRHRSP